MITEINTLSDIEIFVGSLIEEGTTFHPDDDFSQYVNQNSGKRTYSLQEAAQRNYLMERCFSLCCDKGIDIYDFMLEIYLRKTGMEKHIPLPSQPM